MLHRYPAWYLVVYNTKYYVLLYVLQQSYVPGMIRRILSGTLYLVLCRSAWCIPGTYEMWNVDIRFTLHGFQR